MLDILSEIEQLFMEFKNGENARLMRRYMRNRFEFLGIRSCERKQIFNSMVGKFKNGRKIYEEFVLKSFGKEYREFHYIAIDYLIFMKRYFEKEHVLLIEKILTMESWWDTVDLIASNLVGEIYKKYPETVYSHILSWIDSRNIWLRRSSIIFQLRYKESTNLELLENAIKNSLHSKEFFIQKAIGWALREYAKTDKIWVQRFVDNNHLSSLSKREAMKYIKGGGEFS